jgi:hypothetical protein
MKSNSFSFFFISAFLIRNVAIKVIKAGDRFYYFNFYYYFVLM